MSVPDTLIHQFIGQILLGREMSWIIVRVFIPIMITQFFHQLGRCVTNGQRHWLITRSTH